MTPKVFKEVYANITTGNKSWNELRAPKGSHFPWDSSSTYIRHTSFFDDMAKDIPKAKPIKNACVLLNLGDSVTTDHISPGASIARNSPAARSVQYFTLKKVSPVNLFLHRYLESCGVNPDDFNTYGSRRGNCEVMVRGTFANKKLVNRLLCEPGPKTLHIPSNKVVDVFDAAEAYKAESTHLIILAGSDARLGDISPNLVF